MRTIKNNYLTVRIDEKGAELSSIQDISGNEYLWQGDPQYWEDRAPNLFPYIARLTEGKYTLNGQTYHMDIHGFAKDTVFEAEQISDREIVFSIRDTEKTRKHYPYAFRFSITYALQDNKLSVKYGVENTDEKIMYFGVGAHPGFCVPLEAELDFADYYLEFDVPSAAKRVGFSEDCFINGDDRAFDMEEGVRLPLHHDLFDDDAIVLVDMAKAVTLKSDQGNKSVRVEYPDMDYLGLWHWPKTDAPYICIEPWSSLPSRKDVVEDFASQPSLLSLEAGGSYQNEIIITME